MLQHPPLQPLIADTSKKVGLLRSVLLKLRGKGEEGDLLVSHGN